MEVPEFDDDGDLPPGVHRATLREAVRRFGQLSPRRKPLSARLRRIYRLAAATGHLARFVVFGSFVTAKPEPNDIDVMLVMDDDFDVSELLGETRMLFDHPSAQAHLGTSAFWVRRFAALGGEESLIEGWQVKRDGGQRGIVEIIGE